MKKWLLPVLIMSFYQNVLACESFPQCLSQLPYEFSTAATFDEDTSAFYGRYRENKIDYLMSIDTTSHSRKLLGSLPKFDGWVRSPSVFDQKQKRVYFLAYVKGKPALAQVEIGQEIATKVIPLSQHVKRIVFDSGSHSILGLARINRQEHLIRINPSSGDVNTINAFADITSTQGVAISDGKAMFIGKQDNENSLFQFDLKNHELRRISSAEVGLNQVNVIDFKKSNTSQSLLTIGAQSCVDVAGIDVENNIGFVAHFKADYSSVESTLSEINAKLSHLSDSKTSLKSNIQLFVGGGVISNNKSVALLHNVYRYLVSIGVDIGTIKKFNTGVSHDLVIYNKQLIVL